MTDYLTHVLSPVIGSIGVILGVILGFLSDDVVVAAIVAAGGVAAAGVPIMLSTRKKAADIAASVGQKNGHGDLQGQNKEILARLESFQSTGEATLAAVQSMGARLDGHDREFADLKSRVDRLEAT